MSLSTVSNPSNPSHLLINRNPPLPAHPQLFPQSTSRHSGYSHSRRNSTPTLPASHSRARGYVHHAVGGASSGAEGEGDYQDSIVEEEEEVEVHSTFSRNSLMKGNVKVIVGRNEFWCHKEVLWFASPFFQGLLQGNWAENTRHPPTLPLTRRSSSPTDTNHDPDLITYESELSRAIGLGHVNDNDAEVESGDTDSTHEVSSRKGSVYLDAVSEHVTEDQGDMSGVLQQLPELPEEKYSGELYRSLKEKLEETCAQAGHPFAHRSALPSLLAQETAQPLPPITTPPITHGAAPSRSNKSRTLRHSFSSSTFPSRSPVPLTASTVKDNEGAEATVELHEESAAAFQDFLFWAYPHLECKVTWTNVEPLVALSTKLLVPALQGICYHFLLSHASGKPIVALALAEEYGYPELYREASRFVLDQAVWNQQEMDELSSETQLKLSQRRNWFLERLLKLGSIDVKKEYQCRPDCPDPTRCQILIDDKWRQAHLAVCRYGPPQPSVAFRCLRQLETLPTNPSLVMPHPLCQMSAKTWIKNLFDRMFSFRLINSPQNPGTEKYWLAITLS